MFIGLSHGGTTIYSCPSRPDKVWVGTDWGESASLFAATTSGDVYCSDDAGEHWSRIIGGLAPISKGGHYEALAVTL